jgi:hypothetical protein
MDTWELIVRESVRQTLADYTAGTDRFRLQDLAACFTPEGALVYPGSEPMVGPDAIADGLGAQLGPPSVRSTPLTHVRHHVSSMRFGTVTPDRVEASSYFVVFTDVGVDHWGRYRDVLVPVDGRWLFASRQISVDGYSAQSLMRPSPE